MSEETTTEVVTDEAAIGSKDPVAALTEDLQRLQAEYANYRKRVERDRALSAEVAISSVLLEFLAVLDDEKMAGLVVTPTTKSFSISWGR